MQARFVAVLFGESERELTHQIAQDKGRLTPRLQAPWALLHYNTRLFIVIQQSLLSLLFIAIS